MSRTVAIRRINRALGTHATSLDLAGLGLTTVPPRIGKLTELTTLSLNGNSLTEIPVIGQLSKLTHLYLDNNRIRAIPPEIGRLTQLVVLDLFENHLTEISPEISKLIRLSHLDLSRNRLAELAPEIGHLSNLTWLDLSRNQLSELPPEIGQLTELTTLHLYRNRLTELPAAIGRLGRLGTLSVDNNQLEVLPPEVAQLTQLTSLHLHLNRLTTLPPELDNLTLLDTTSVYTADPDFGGAGLTLGGNVLSEELQAAAEAGIDVLGTYLRQVAAEGVPLWEGKILFVGEGEVGKTSLLGALRGDPWQEDRDETHGLEIKPLDLSHPDTSAVTIGLNAWDFAGQEVYRPTHQLFFTGPAVYVVVWKPRAGSQQGAVDYWLRMIRLRAPAGSRALVVASHGGPSGPQPHLDQAELRRAHGDLIAGFYSVDSAVDDDRLQAVRDAISAEAAALPEMGHPFPESWTDFRCALTPETEGSDVEPFRRFDRLARAAEDAGLAETAAVALTAIASRRGQWIHYGAEPPRSDDLIVTRPDWLAKAISYVLEDEQTRLDHGILAVGRLAEIWNNPEREQQYPADLYPVFLDLMDAFDLAYRVDQTAAQRAENGELWLVAQLVADDPDPARLTAVKPHRSHRRHTVVVDFYDKGTGKSEPAEGLFFRLIVRLHPYSLGAGDYTKAVHWKRGIVLRHPYYGQAIISAEATSLRIEATGPRPDWFTQQIVRDVQGICAEFWAELGTELSVTCVAPCGLDEPGRGRLPLEELLEHEYPTVRCRERGCRTHIDVEHLLLGHSALTDPVAQQIEKLGQQIAAQDMNAERRHREHIDQLHRQGDQLTKVITSLSIDAAELAPRIVDRLLPHLDDRFERLDLGLDGLDSDLRDLAADLNRGLEVLMESLDALNGPRLILPYVNDPTGLRRAWQKIELRLVLYCEHSRQPVWALNEDDGLGRYTVSIGRESVKRWLPVASIATTLLTGFTPLSVLDAGEHLSRDNWDKLKGELELATRSIETLSSSLGLPGRDAGQPGQGGSESDIIDRATLAGLHELIRQQDPGFGGLVPVRHRQSRRRMWVDPRFRTFYPSTAN